MYNPRHHRFAFTLVEVIVVAVIVAIIAAVAIPNYMQYVADSRQDAVTQLSESAAASANSWLRRKGTMPTLAQLELHYDDSRYEVQVKTDTSILVWDKQHTSYKDSASFK